VAIKNASGWVINIGKVSRRGAMMLQQEGLRYASSFVCRGVYRLTAGTTNKIERAIYERIEADRAAISDIWQPSRRRMTDYTKAPTLSRQVSSLSSPKLRCRPCPSRERSRQAREGASRTSMKLSVTVCFQATGPSLGESWNDQ
jgi:hypothetical protein